MRRVGREMSAYAPLSRGNFRQRDAIPHAVRRITPCVNASANREDAKAFLEMLVYLQHKVAGLRNTRDAVIATFESWIPNEFGKLDFEKVVNEGHCLDGNEWSIKGAQSGFHLIREGFSTSSEKAHNTLALFMTAILSKAASLVLDDDELEVPDLGGATLPGGRGRLIAYLKTAVGLAFRLPLIESQLTLLHKQVSQERTIPSVADLVRWFECEARVSALTCSGKDYSMIKPLFILTVIAEEVERYQVLTGKEPEGP